MVEPARIRVPPHSVEAERSLLGALMLEPKAWARVAPVITEASFYRADHRLVFRAIAELVDRNLAADAITVADHLQRQGQLEAAGGQAYLARLVDDTPSAVNAEGYAKVVREKFTLRRFLAELDQMQRAAREGNRDAAELIADAGERLMRLQADARRGRGLVESRALVGELLDDLDRRRAGARGLSVGLADFDALTLGLEPGYLTVIAGRPGTGKTALMCSIAAHVSQSSGVAIFSAEMPRRELMRRCVALLSNVAQGQMRHADTLTEDDWIAISDATSSLAGRRLWIDDSPRPTLLHVRSEVLALRARTDLGLVLVDYAQLLRGTGANRYEEMRDVSDGLKELAKQANLPVIALAQLNRSVERRENKRPTLSDLRDSGSFEESADIVGLLFSESYYDEQFAMPGVLECELAKNRDGPPHGLCFWRFAGEFSRIGVLEPGAREHYIRLRTQARRGAADDDL